MQIAELEEYIFQIDYIVNKSFHQNLSCFCQSKNSNDPF
jgi:hypothetical protein